MATPSLRVAHTKPRSSLMKLAAQIKQEHAAFEQSLKRGLEHARHAGDLLIEAKSRLGHGEWLPWLKSNCKMSEWSCQAYMRIARRFGELGKSGTVTDLSFRDGLKLLAETHQERYSASVMQSPQAAQTTRKVTVQVYPPTIKRVTIPAYYGRVVKKPPIKVGLPMTTEPGVTEPEITEPLVTPTTDDETTGLSEMAEREFKATLVDVCRAYERNNGVRLDTLQVVRDGAGLIQQIDLWPS